LQDDSDEDDDSDEEEEGDEKEFEGFIAGAEGEEGGEAADGADAEGDAEGGDAAAAAAARRRKRRRRAELELAEEDYALVEENTGVRVERPAKKAHRRLQRARDVGGAAPGAGAAPAAEADTARRSAADQLRAELFGEDDDDEGGALGAAGPSGAAGAAAARHELEDDIEDDAPPAAGRAAGRAAPAPSPRARQDGDDDDFSEDEDDWIVDEFDEEEGGDGDGAGGAGGGRSAAAKAARRARRRAAAAAAPEGVDAAALEEAHEIFGDVDDLLATYALAKARRARKAARALAGGGEGLDEEEGAELEGLEEEEEPDAYAGLEPSDLSDDEAAAELRAARARRAAAAARRPAAAAAAAAAAALEPEAAARHFLLPTDEAVRAADLPERVALRALAERGAAALAPRAGGGEEEEEEELDLDEAAGWVLSQLLGDRAPDSKARATLETGAREVDGPPPAWLADPERPGEWPPGALRGGAARLDGARGLFRGRARDEDEAAWRADAGAQAGLRDATRAALRLLHEAHEEVPVLGMYRKEALGELLALRGADEPADPDDLEEEDEGQDAEARRAAREQRRGRLTAECRRARRWDVLWAVQALFGRWRALARRRAARAAAYAAAADAAEEAGAPGAAVAAARRAAGLAAAAAGPEALVDAEALFRLAADEAAAAAADGGAAAAAEAALAALTLGGGGRGGAPRRPRRASAAARALRGGLSAAAAALGLPPARYAENLEAGYRVHEPADPEEAPEAWAASFVDAAAPGRADAAAVLAGAARVAAARLAAEPGVRSAARELFWERGTLDTTPTADGEASLDPFSPLGPAKRLRGKPLRRLRERGGDLFLKVAVAEARGLVAVRLGLPEGEGGAEAALSALSDLYLSSGVTAAAGAWNALRTRVLRAALLGALVPALAAEARGRLGAEARAAALQGAADALWALAARPPLRVGLAEEEHGWMELGERRLMGAVHGPGKPAATTFVMLDAAGALVDFCHCPQLSGERVWSGGCSGVSGSPASGACVHLFAHSWRPRARIRNPRKPARRAPVPRTPN
jgi:transcription elongation factor SPT6